MFVASEEQLIHLLMSGALQGIRTDSCVLFAFGEIGVKVVKL